MNERWKDILEYCFLALIILLDQFSMLSHQRKAIELFQQLVLDYPAAVRETAESFLRFAMLHFDVITKCLGGSRRTKRRGIWLTADGFDY